MEESKRLAMYQASGKTSLEAFPSWLLTMVGKPMGMMSSLYTSKLLGRAEQKGSHHPAKINQTFTSINVCILRHPDLTSVCKSSTPAMTSTWGYRSHICTNQGAAASFFHFSCKRSMKEQCCIPWATISHHVEVVLGHLQPGSTPSDVLP